MYMLCSGRKGKGWEDKETRIDNRQLRSVYFKSGIPFPQPLLNSDKGWGLLGLNIALRLSLRFLILGVTSQSPGTPSHL